MLKAGEPILLIISLLGTLVLWFAGGWGFGMSDEILPVIIFNALVLAYIWLLMVSFIKRNIRRRLRILFWVLIIPTILYLTFILYVIIFGLILGFDVFG